MLSTLKNMQDLRLFTTRLELVAATVELAQAEIGDLSAFAGLLNVPSSMRSGSSVRETIQNTDMVLKAAHDAALGAAAESGFEFSVIVTDFDECEWTNLAPSEAPASPT
jgi:hypothetical protein